MPSRVLLMGAKMIKLKYNNKKYNFEAMVRDCFGVGDLEKIHLNLDKKYDVPDGIPGLGKDTDSYYHKLFYNKLNGGWEELTNAYHGLIKEVVMKYMNVDKVVYQTKPTFRIQYPDGKAITTWHYDGDDNHKHPPWEINIQIALTEMKGDLSTWIETVPGLKDFKPMEMNVGEMYIFNGNKCIHGNKVNSTDKTRISFDFRVIPHDRYDPNFQKKSATKNQKFLLGGYYSLMDLGGKDE